MVGHFKFDRVEIYEGISLDETAHFVLYNLMVYLSSTVCHISGILKLFMADGWKIKWVKVHTPQKSTHTQTHTHTHTLPMDVRVHYK